MLNKFSNRCHNMAKEKGWYNKGERNIPELLCLIHSEISEALEEYRNTDPDGNGNLKCYFNNRIGIKGQRDKTYLEKFETIVKAAQAGHKPEGFEIEIADVFIRLFDLCGYLGIDIDSAIEAKLNYNQTRPFRHGNKLA